MNNYYYHYYYHGWGHCVFLISDESQIYANFSLASMFLFKESFLRFGKHNNLQSDNFQYNSEYSNSSYNLKKHLMKE